MLEVFADYLQTAEYTMSKVERFVLPKFNADLGSLHGNFSSLVLVSLMGGGERDRYFHGTIQNNDITYLP